ncbi:MAG: PilZ domain-containing protein [Planctomycetota bacterium]|jgi:transcriptional regulator with XRE-family HTH domain
MGVSQAEIASRLGLARSTVTKILNQFPNNRASKETIKQVFKAAREMGYDFSRLRNIHRRRALRKKVDLPVELRLTMSDTQEIYDTGSAVVRDLSPYGALLEHVRTGKGSLPLASFIMEMKFSGPLAGVIVKARVIRFVSEESVQVGLDFIDVSSEAERQIIEIIE